jgi:hypothetical protein
VLEQASAAIPPSPGSSVPPPSVAATAVPPWPAAPQAEPAPQTGARPRRRTLLGAAAAGAASASSPSAPAAPGYSGTWSGTMDQPIGIYVGWTVVITPPADSGVGTFSPPSLGCSGTLEVASSSAE